MSCKCGRPAEDHQDAQMVVKLIPFVCWGYEEHEVTDAISTEMAPEVDDEIVGDEMPPSLDTPQGPDLAEVVKIQPGFVRTRKQKRKKT